MIISLSIIGLAGALLGLWLNWRTIPLIGSVLFVAYAGNAWSANKSPLISVLTGFAPLFVFSAAFVSAGVLQETRRGVDTIAETIATKSADHSGDAPN